MSNKPNYRHRAGKPTSGRQVVKRRRRAIRRAEDGLLRPGPPDTSRTTGSAS